MSILKLITRGAMKSLAFVVLLPLVAWYRLELWAFYDNDEDKRDKDYWRYSK